MAVPIQHPVLEPAAGHRGQKDRRGAFAANPVDKQPEILLIGAPGSGITRRVALLGVVVTELDKHVVPFLYGIQYLVPESQVDEALGTASILGVIDHRNG